MNKPFLYVLIATLGLAGCGGGGGGGGGGGSDSGSSSGPNDPGATTGGVTAAKLRGVWMRSDLAYFPSATLGEREWLNTERNTIIVEGNERALTFRDCGTGETLTGALSDNVVTFEVQSGLDEKLELAVDSVDRLVGAYEKLSTTEVDVVLQKLAASEQPSLILDIKVPVMGDMDISSPGQLCMASTVSEAETELRFHAVSQGAKVNLTFEFDGALESARYQYSSANDEHDISGDFLFGGLYDTLSRPEGNIDISIGSTTVFTINSGFSLLTDSGDHVVEVNEGVVEFRFIWLEKPEL